LADLRRWSGLGIRRFPRVVCWHSWCKGGKRRGTLPECGSDRWGYIARVL
jgi:hypothetical protein